MIYRALRRFTLAKAIVGQEPFYFIDRYKQTEFHGTDYGGWAILANSLDRESIVYSFGLGEDISFDQSILAKYGCQVYGFDPTPKAIDWVEKHLKNDCFRFQPMAVSTSNAKLRLYYPNDESTDGVSASALLKSDESSPFFDANANTLGAYLEQFTQWKCDLLKMDVEGAEYAVLKQAVENNWLSGVKQLLVEFHHWMRGIGPTATRAAVSMLKQAGFEIAWISRTNHEYLFVRA